MKIDIGLYPRSEAFKPGRMWQVIPAPDSKKIQLQALPMSLLLSGITLGFGLPFFQITITSVEAIIGILLSMVIVLPLHQLVQSGYFPEDPRSERVHYGIDLPSMTMFAYYDGQMHRKDYVTSLIAPFLLLSVLPTMLMYTFHRYMNLVMVMMIVNALVSGMDLMALIRLMKATEKGSIIRRKGSATYYKVTKSAEQRQV